MGPRPKITLFASALGALACAGAPTQHPSAKALLRPAPSRSVSAECEAAAALQKQASELLPGRFARALALESRAAELCPESAPLGQQRRQRALAGLRSDETSAALFAHAESEHDSVALDRALIALEREQSARARVGVVTRAALGARAISADGRRVAYAEDGQVVVWDVAAGREARTLPCLGEAMGLGFVGQRLVVKSGAGSHVALEAWDVDTGKRLASRRFLGASLAQSSLDQPPGSNRDCGPELCLTPSGEVVAGVSDPSSAFDRVELLTPGFEKRFEVRHPRCLSADSCPEAEWSGDQVRLAGVFADPAWQRLAVSFSDGAFVLVEVASGRVLVSEPALAEPRAFSNDFRYVLGASRADGSAHVLDTRTRRLSELKVGADCDARDGIFSPDGAFLYVGGVGHVCAWDTRRRRAASVFPKSGGMEASVRPALGPRGRELWIELDLHIRQRFDTLNARELETPFSVQRVARSDGSVVLLNATGSPVLDFDANGVVTETGAPADDWLLGGLAFSRDGELSIDHGSPCQVRSTRSGKVLAEIPTQLCVTPGWTADGRFLLVDEPRALVSVPDGKVLFQAEPRPELRGRPAALELGRSGSELGVGNARLSAAGELRWTALHHERRPFASHPRQAAASGLHVTLLDAATRAELASAEVSEEVEVIDQRPSGSEVLLRGLQSNWLWRPFEAGKKLEPVAGYGFRAAPDGSPELIETEQTSARIAAGKRTLGYSGADLWLLPFAATTPTWFKHLAAEQTSAPCVSEVAGKRSLAIAQTPLELTFFDLDSGRELARFEGGDQIVCGPRGDFVVAEVNGHVQVYSTDPPALEATFTALLVAGADGIDESAKKALVMVRPDGRFDFVGSREVAMAGLRCVVGTQSVPLQACAERLETPGLIAEFAAKRLLALP